MTGQGTMKRNTSRGEHAYELFHPKPAKAPIGWPMFKTGQKRPSGVRFKTGQSALGSDAPSKSPSRLVKSTRRNYCESFCPNHVHWPVLKRPSLAGFQAPLDIPGSWNEHSRAGKIFATDLRRAGITQTNEQGKSVDFHSLRYTFITSLAKAGVHPSKAQRLARHSTITLTMNVYT